jgi:hypothetical protein
LSIAAAPSARLDREALLAQVAGEQLAQALVVVDDENLGFAIGHGTNPTGSRRHWPARCRQR